MRTITFSAVFSICLRRAQLVGHRDQICLAQTRTVRHMQAKSQIWRATKITTDSPFAPFLTSGMTAPQDLLIPSVPKKADPIPQTNSGPLNCEITDSKMFTISPETFHHHRRSLSQKCPNSIILVVCNSFRSGHTVHSACRSAPLSIL